MEEMAQFQTQVPYPLTDDLPKLLSPLGMRDPAISRLLAVFIGEDRLEGSSMQVEVDDIGRREGR
jgi:hypothetical protein